jgi:hypothetical protein
VLRIKLLLLTISKELLSSPAEGRKKSFQWDMCPMGERDLASFVPDEEAYGNGLEESGRRDSPQWVQKFFPTGIERSQEGQKARLQTLHWPSRISAVQWGQNFIRDEAKTIACGKAKQSI